MNTKKYYGYPEKPGFIYCFPWDKPVGAIEIEGPSPSIDHILQHDGTWKLDTKVEYILNNITAIKAALIEDSNGRTESLNKIRIDLKKK